MKKFVGKVFTLISALALIILSFVGGGFILYDFIKGNLNVLTQTVYFNGWIALLSTFIIIIGNFFLSLISLKNLSINATNKNILIGSIILFIFSIFSFAFILIKIGTFENYSVFLNVYILTFIFYLLLIFGIIIDIKN